MNLLREVLSNIKNNKGGCLITVGTITISMLILGTFLLLFVNLKNLAIGLGDTISLIVYLEDNISKKAQNRIGMSIRNRKEVENVQFISKEDALINFKRDLGEDGVILEGLEVNPLPSSFKVRIKTDYSDTEHINEIAAFLGTQTGVESVEYGKKWLEKFEAVIAFFRLAAICAGSLLYVGLMLIISNTIKLSLYSNIKEIRIMKLVGAADWYIKGPFIIEGMIEGFLGANFSLIFLFLLYYFFVLKIDSLMLHTTLFDSITFISVSAAAGIIASGMIIGCAGSIISIRKFLKEI